jgi:hypothetical protein
MNKFETIQDLIDHLSALPKSVKHSPVLTAKGASGSDYTSLSGASFMYVDKDYTDGYADEVWEKEDLTESAADEEEAQEILSRFKKVLVLWFE